MANESDTHEQRITDARMEYGHLLATYLSLANMYWVGYGAFFTINTLLATGLGLSYSEAAKLLDRTFLLLAHILIPTTGIFISVVAIYAAKSIADFQGKINERGRELETILFARIFTGSRRYAERFPKGTAIGSLLFLALWASTLYAAI
jgi:hypothetical protein